MIKLLQLTGMISIGLSLYPATLQKSRTLDDIQYPDRAFLTAASNGDLELVEELIDRVDINCTNRVGRTAVHLAAMSGHTATLSFLLSKGAKAYLRDSQNLTALHWTAIAGFCGCIEKLYTAGADINARDPLGYTPVHFAAENGQALSLGELIRLRATLNVVTHEKKETPLHLAAAQGNKNCVLALIKAHKRDRLSTVSLEAFVNAETHDLWSPLHYAAHKGNVVLVDLLMRYGANVNAVTKDQKTPLHLALESSKEDSVQTVEKILSHAPDLSLADAHGLTALDSATQSHNQAKIDLIRNALRVVEEQTESSSTSIKKRNSWKMSLLSLASKKKSKTKSADPLEK